MTTQSTNSANNTENTVKTPANASENPGKANEAGEGNDAGKENEAGAGNKPGGSGKGRKKVSKTTTEPGGAPAAGNVVDLEALLAEARSQLGVEGGAGVPSTD